MNSTIDSFYTGLEENWRILNSDKHQYDLPLLRSPWPALLITHTYLLFATILGPTFMKSREPYDLKWLMLTYNFVQIILNFYVACWSFYIIVWLRTFGLSCVTILTAEHPLKLLELKFAYIFFMLKFLDLFDTLFLVLRKKSNQITFLHVYHHYIVSTLSVIYIKHVGLGGHSCTFCLANTIVHTVMYSYYFLTALRPELRSNFWWKRYITKLQILQFYLLVIHNCWPLIFVPDCPHPKWLLKLTASQFAFMIVLFTSFYRKAYLMKPATEYVVKDAKKSKLLNAGGKMD